MHIFESWVPILTRHIPSLRELDIDLSRTQDVMLMESHLFGGQPLRQLARLSLKNCIVPPKSNLLSTSLTHLSLAMGDYADYEPEWMSTAKFRSHLKSVPNLEELRLSDVLPYHDRETVEPTFSFPPTFKKLHVHCSNELVSERCYSQFWTHFRIPNTAVVVSLVYDHSSGFRASQALKPLVELDPLDPPPMEMWISQTSMRICFGERPRDEWTRCLVIPSPADMRASDTWEGTGGSRALYTDGLTATDYVSHKAFDVVRAINFSLDAAEAYDTPTEPAGLWISKFDTNALVKRISAPYTACGKLFNALAQRDTITGALRLFPQLEVIVFSDQTTVSGATLHTALDMALLDMLEVRREVGKAIRELLVARKMADWSVWENVGEGTYVTFFD
ncbi:unnamed protein product [Peniophora sp. CBMAI 1063]|nr:unnamed protein product [Peniophora sp. CBMAI 1063]